MWWDRENELDLADIGGETGAATHGANIASSPGRPKGWTERNERAIVEGTNEEHYGSELEADDNGG
jgi:hypothetical protein